MSRELHDRRRRFFGREEDVAALMARAAKPGLTAVVGRPQIGKSWLLNEVARRLASEEPKRLVGIAESKGETPDLLLRAIEDLYARWLEDAGARQQARMVWDRQRKNLLPAVAKAVSAIFTAAEVAAAPIAAVVREGLDGLLAANRELTTGGLRLPVLQYDQARDLLRAVHGVTGTPLVLILDQWEKSPDVGTEAKTLDSFIRYVDEWPPCHIIVVLWPEEPAQGAAEDLAALRPGVAEVMRLGEMRLDQAEGHRLATWVRGAIPAAAEQSDAALLAEVSGFAGVLMRWHDQRCNLASSEDLKRLAKDAHAYRFRELEQSLRTLDGDLRRLAIRLVLLPQGGGELWPAIKDEVLSGIDEALLDNLCLEQILEAQDPPDFGHTKRFEIARAWLVEHCRSTCRSEVERLIIAFGARVRMLDTKARPFSLALLEQVYLAQKLAASDLAQAACLANAALFGYEVGPGPLDRISQLILGSNDYGVTPLLAMGLVRTINNASNEGDLPRRDTLLDGLRTLAREHLEEAAVREQLACGLFNTLNHANNEGHLTRRDALLDELRALAKAHAEDSEVRVQFVKGLYNALVYAQEEGALPRRDTLLDELRTVAAAHRDDAVVREQLASSLFNALIYANGEGNLRRRDSLLDELRTLAQVHPDDTNVRENLAMGLVNTHVYARAEGNLSLRDLLLNDLRTLAHSHPDDSFVRRNLAMSLLNTMSGAQADGVLQRRSVLLDELRVLARKHSDDAPVREQLAKGLAKTMLDTDEEGAAERSAELREELRALAEAYSDDEWVTPARDDWLI